VLVAFWTPPLLQKAGMSARAAASVLAVQHAGGVIGTVLIGVILAGFVRIVCSLRLLVSAVHCRDGNDHRLLSRFGNCKRLRRLSFFRCRRRADRVARRVSADARATGVGGQGLGRLGSILGPLGAGFLVAQAWQVRAFIYHGLSALLAAGLVTLLARELASRPIRTT